MIVPYGSSAKLRQLELIVAAWPKIGRPARRRTIRKTITPPSSQSGGTTRPARWVPSASTQTSHESRKPATAGSGISERPKRTLPRIITGRGRDGSTTRSLITARNTAMNASMSPNE